MPPCSQWNAFPRNHVHFQPVLAAQAKSKKHIATGTQLSKTYSENTCHWEIHTLTQRGSRRTGSLKVCLQQDNSWLLRGTLVRALQREVDTLTEIEKAVELMKGKVDNIDAVNLPYLWICMSKMHRSGKSARGQKDHHTDNHLSGQKVPKILSSSQLLMNFSIPKRWSPEWR